MASRSSHDAEPAYVLHTYAFRETSFIVEAYSRNHGRVGLVARGARRPGSSLRGLLLPFQPILISWTGSGELRTLTRAEWDGGYAPLSGQALMCGFYLNELLMRLMAREDAHEALFDRYEAALAELQQTDDQPRVLRAFERVLLKELGYAMTLDRDAETGGPIDPDARSRSRGRLDRDRQTTKEPET